MTGRAFRATKSGVAFLVSKATGSSSSSSSNAAASPSATEAQTTQQTAPTPTPVAAPKPVPVAAPSSGGFFKGMQCQARYTADGNYYRAIIKDINTANNTYLVNYPEYGNEEVCLSFALD